MRWVGLFWCFVVFLCLVSDSECFVWDSVMWSALTRETSPSAESRVREFDVSERVNPANVHILSLGLSKNKRLHISKCMCPRSSWKSCLFGSICVCVCTMLYYERSWASAWVWSKWADRQMNMPQCDQKRGRRCQKQEEDRAGRAWMEEKVGRAGAPDLTTLTHSGLSVLASCALWSTNRGHTYTHIYLSTHAGDEDILGLGECLWVWMQQPIHAC